MKMQDSAVCPSKNVVCPKILHFLENKYNIYSNDKIVTAKYVIIATPAFLKRTVEIEEKLPLKDTWIFVITGLIGMFAINLCYNFAVKELTLSLAAVLLSMSPIFVIILNLFNIYINIGRQR